mgnify:CR=1 FL=1
MYLVRMRRVNALARHLKACKQEGCSILNTYRSQKTGPADPALACSHDGVRTDRIYIHFLHHSSVSYVESARHTHMYSAPAVKLYETGWQ